MSENFSVIITWWRYSHHTWIVLLSIYYWYRCFFLCTHLVIVFRLITYQHFIYAWKGRETDLLVVASSSLYRSRGSCISCNVVVTLYEIVCLFVVILRLVYQLLHLCLFGCVFFLLYIIHKDVAGGGNFLLLCEFSSKSFSIKSWRLVVWNP